MRVLETLLKFIFILAAICAVPSIAAAMPSPHVQDDGGFFSTDAVAKANEKIAQIKRDFGKDLFIQTVSGIPEAKKAAYQPNKRAQFFQQWSLDIGQTNRVDGVVVLISKDPAYLQVAPSHEMLKQGFVASDRDRLSQIMLASLKTKDYDKALLDGVQYVADTFAQSLPKGAPAGQSTGTKNLPNASPTQPPTRVPQQQPQPQPSPGLSMGSWLCFGIGALLIVMLIFRALAARRSIAGGMPGQGYGPMTGGPPAGPGYGYGGGFGGGGRGFLGGLLGGMLGGYMYDRMRGYGGSRDSSTSVGGTFGDSGGGGSFDAPSGGGDAGSFGSMSDFGGGDAGGGDFGGGGF